MAGLSFQRLRLWCNRSGHSTLLPEVSKFVGELLRLVYSAVAVCGASLTTGLQCGLFFDSFTTWLFRFINYSSTLWLYRDVECKFSTL